MVTIEIRDAFPEEYETVGEVTVVGYGADHSLPEYAAVLRNVVKRAETCDILVATLDGVIVGAAAYPHKGGPYEDIAHAAHEGEFRMLAVIPEGRGHGIGEKLSVECIRRAKVQGRTVVVISVVRDNGPAERIYERLGFVRVPARDWVAPDGMQLQCWELDLVPYCGICGQLLTEGTHEHRGAELEPDRYCHHCARRLVVQVMPTGSVTKPCVCVKPLG